jgi:hypothetical protein
MRNSPSGTRIPLLLSMMGSPIFIFYSGGGGKADMPTFMACMDVAWEMDPGYIISNIGFIMEVRVFIQHCVQQHARILVAHCLKNELQ